MKENVNQKILARAEKVIDILRNKAKALDVKYNTYEYSNYVEGITLNVGYAEPGYSNETGIVALGNWNEKKNLDIVRVGNILERMGVDLEWSDEWCNCDECGALIRTHPDCYSWTFSGVELEASIVCKDCFQKSPDLSVFECNENKALTIDLNLEEYGYKIIDNYTVGYHGNSPLKEHIKCLKDEGCFWIVKVESTEQFQTHFSLWVHENYYDVAKEMLS